ncbi:trafficking kinesin-binding protein 1 [Garra rufa]|uniref:trafficking kinesin-binding protein 1 n=1 Tax=Garra rufa TaxID=137080 RepID=UPI003CCE624B
MNVCNSTDLPEVEIISLLEEQLPHYKLRADTIYGYDHDDWLHTPLISPDVNLDLTTEQIEETLKYFLLCADRVGQMTKTYNDIDAVTRLLEEKERDLELAARIGQSLLKKNKTLSERNTFLEEQVEHIREEVSQLRHDLSMKDELLQFYTSAAEESDGDSASSTPIRRNDSSFTIPNYLPLDSLQKKLKDLEEENISLRSEANHLETETISYEEKEQQLVNDCVKELRDANIQISTIAEELAKKTEDASRQQEEITHLLSQIVDLQKKSLISFLYLKNFCVTLHAYHLVFMISLCSQCCMLCGIFYSFRFLHPSGSATLHAWQQLAQPHLGGILDARPGVVTKGFRPLELDLEEVYQFTDLEEDELGQHSQSAISTSFMGSLPCSPSLRRPRANNPDNQEEHLKENGGTPGVGPDRMEAGEEEVSSVHFPGKCMSHTSSTYTFTTCRILHPTDELTRVTPSLLSGPSLASCVMSSSSLRSTPVSTPCTPRRLSLAESFTNLRDSTKTTCTSLGLVRLLQERGISAAVYNPLSWDRADRAPPPDPCSSHTATPTHTGPDTLPSTPPNSPSKSKPTSPVLPVDYSPSDPPYETFLASRPARSILKEVREADERARTDTQCQTEVSVQNLRLVDKVKKFSLAPRTLTPGIGRPGPAFGAHAVVTSPIGGLPVLNSGMRRNRSYPAMVGASMAMKGPGPPSEDLLLAPRPPRQTSLSEK